jgi:hypothetical protein
MPTIDYSAFANVANNLLTKFGSTATLTSKPAGTYDPNNSTASVTPVTQSVTAVAFPYPAKLVDGTMVQVGDFQAFVAPSGVTTAPQAADKFTYLGVVYTVINVKVLNPAGTVILYEMQVRK